MMDAGRTALNKLKHPLSLNVLIWRLIKISMSYKKLGIWQLSREVVMEVHKMSLQLPKFEQFEQG